MAIKDLQMPVANQEAADRAKAAQGIALQEQLRVGAPGTAVPAGQLAAQQTAAQGQIAAAGAAAEAGRQVQTQQTNFQQQQVQQQQQDLLDQQRLENKRLEQGTHLSRLKNDVREEFADDKARFQIQAGDARFTAQRQLADFAVSKSMDEEGMRNYQQAVEQSTAMDIQMMNQAWQVYDQKERQMLASGEAQLDRESLTRIRAKKAWLKEQEQKARRKAAQTRKIIGAAKAATGAAIIYSSGGTATGAGAPLIASGAQDMGST